MRPVTSRDEIMSGEPCIDGTRIPAALLASELELGTPIDKLARDFLVSEAEIRNAVAWHHANAGGAHDGDRRAG